MGKITRPRPLTADDDRESFDCGRASLNHWFRRHGWRNQRDDVSRTNVLCDVETGAIIGYVSLSASQLERGHLPKSAQRNRPDPVPAVLLGQLAIDMAYQRQGIGADLLLFAFTTSIRFSQSIGCFGIITHPIDDQVRAFYARFGFETLPHDPHRAMFIRLADLAENHFAAQR